ncbi:MAG: response regulator [Deltaproteobacteria bacterium]|nr:response regulator [Deltaproteobacteria bacterium]
MSRTLRLLVAEDSEDDYELLRRELQRGGFAVTAERIASTAALREALAQSWDLVITDWSMPGFDGADVLAMVRAHQLPCIVISGTPNEEAAVEALRAGALDFLAKEKPGRFVPAIHRALREAADHRVAQELNRRSVELELQNQRIHEASRLKSEFLANMSHELRTPLNAIIGFAELLHDGAVDPASPMHHEFLGDILASGRHLLQLVNDVLDLSKVEAGKLAFRPEPVDLGRVVDELVAILRTQAAAKRIRIHIEIGATLGDIVLDPARLKQVAYNFLSNALKFTSEGGTVTLQILAEDAERLRIVVIDPGIGIAAHDLGKLFVEFQQLEAGTAKRHQGTGLGLALTRRLVEAQGGFVGVDSTLGAGSTFYAVLPRKVSVLLEGTRPIPRLTGLRRVLVVEDDMHDQDQIIATLSEAGYAVELASTGAQALALWRSTVFDAATIDLLLPDMSGVELLGQLRREGRTLSVPVIVVTVLPDARAVAGFDVHEILQKPLDRASLLASLARAGVGVGVEH